MSIFKLMSQGSLNPKIRFLGQKVSHVARPDTKVNTKDALSGFHGFLSSRIGPKPAVLNLLRVETNEIRSETYTQWSERIAPQTHHI